MRVAQLQLPEQRDDAAPSPASTCGSDQAAGPTVAPLPDGRAAAFLHGPDDAPQPTRRRTGARRRAAVPDVVALGAVEAVALVRDAGLTPVIEQHPAASPQEVGTVLLQEPAPGDELPRGSSLELWIGTQERTPSTPDEVVVEPTITTPDDAQRQVFDRDRAYVVDETDAWFTPDVHARPATTPPETSAVADVEAAPPARVADDEWFGDAAPPVATEEHEHPDVAAAPPADAAAGVEPLTVDAARTAPQAERRRRPTRRVVALACIAGVVLLLAVSTGSRTSHPAVDGHVAASPAAPRVHEPRRAHPHAHREPRSSSQGGHRPSQPARRHGAAPSARRSRAAAPSPTAAPSSAPVPASAPVAPSGGSAAPPPQQPSASTARPASATQPVRREFFTP